MSKDEARDVVRGFQDYAEFLKIAGKCSSYPEFMLEVVCHARADLGTVETFKNLIYPVYNGDFSSVISKETLSSKYINFQRLADSLQEELLRIPWLDDYIAAKRTEVSNVKQS